MKFLHKSPLILFSLLFIFSSSLISSDFPSDRLSSNLDISTIKRSDDGTKEIIIDESIQTYTYNKSIQSFIIKGEVTDNFVITYKYHTSGVAVNEPITASAYDVSIYRDADETYASYSKTISSGLIIEKAHIDMSNVKWSETTSFIYDGNEHSVTLNNLPSEVLATYSNNVKTEPGKYTACASFTYDKDNYEPVEFMDLTWEIRINELNTSLKTPRGVIVSNITAETGFEYGTTHNAIFEVNAEEYEVSTSEMIVDYKTVIGSGDILKDVYRLYLSLNGERINLSDIKEGLKATVKVAIPLDVLDVNFKLMLVTNTDDIRTLTKIDSTELGDNDYYIEDGYIVTLTDSLGAFLYVASKPVEYFHYVMIGGTVAFIAFTLIMWFVFKKHKHDIATILGGIFFFAFNITFICLGQCPICIVFTAVNFILLIGYTLLFYFGRKIYKHHKK